jgi:hypothetical protein
MKLTYAFLIFCLTAVSALATNAPTNLNVNATSNSQVSLTWTDNSSDESGFTFMFDTNAAFTNPTYVYAGGTNTTSYTHNNLNHATTYYYKIKAEGNPDSSWTSADYTTTAPSGLSATPTSNSALNLSWSGNSGNANVTGYTYAYATNSAFTSATYVWVAGNGSSSTSRSGLSTATTYWVKIKAEGTNDSFDSPLGPAVATTTTPASLAATVVSSSQINLSWSGNSGNTNITGYTVARATNSAFTSASYFYVNGAGATSYSSSGLSAGATYYYKIKAEGTSDAYDSPFTTAISATTTGAAPNAPSNLAATVVSSSRIDLSWTDNSTNETSFELQRATDSAFTQNVLWIGGIQGSSYSNTGLAASTTYYYRVRAKGTSQDSAYSSAASGTTSSSSVPAAPSSLAATVVSNSRINLSWTDNSSNETGFELKRATDSAFTQNVVWIGGISGTTYGNTGLSPSTTYYYKVRAEGTAGKSAYSNTVSATTTGNTPPAEGIAISPRFFGINAWMPRRVGEEMKYGKLDDKWTQVQDSRVTSIRYGGIAVDEAEPGWVEGGGATDLCPPDSRESTMKQYVDIVEDIRAAGAEPILQVPVLANQRNEHQAADLVQCINVTLGMGVKYWSIGNEPDLAYAGFDSGDIAEYIRRFSSAMKNVDPSIKIVAPETAWYDWTNVLDPLTGGGADDVTGADGNGNYYVDVISFHAYPYPTKDGSGNKVWPSRSDVIGKLATFDSNLNQLKTRIAQRNAARSRSGDDAITIAVTEANINYESPSTDSIDGVGASSFLGGQFWAEMLGIAMQHGVDFFNFWSVIEGNNVSSDNGYLCRDGVTLHPSYHHFRMMAENFRGNALTSSDNLSNVKTFAAKDTDQVAVMLINMDGSADVSYAVSLNSTASSATLLVNVPANISATQSTGTLYKQSTILLIFDSSGTLKKKIEYKRYGADGNPSLTETIY